MTDPSCQLLHRGGSAPIEKFMNGHPSAFDYVMKEIDPQDVMSSTMGLVRHSCLIKNNSEIIGSKDDKNSKKKQKQRNVAERNTDSNQDTDRGRHVLVSKEHARAESHGRDENRQTLHLVQAVELGTIRTTHHLKVENECKKQYSKDMLQTGTQRIGEDNDHCQNSLSEHDDRLPEYIFPLVRAIQKSTGLIDPSTLVVLFDVFNGEASSG